MSVPENPFSAIETKWQQTWEAERLDDVNLRAATNPYYTHVMFPYPSGDRLHVGHVYNYAPADAFARYMRMKGHTVLSPMGFDAFGLPAENHAIKTGIHPSVQIRDNIETMISQLKRLGCMYDWSKTLNTSDPSYYKWTQTVFLTMHKRGLAYRKESLVNWCPGLCQTTLANEQIEDGRCERCRTLVVLRPMKQWYFRITQYVDRLIEGLDSDRVKWPELTKTLQRNWFGRSTGINFKQRVKGMNIEFEVFDSIPQTFIAQTFTVIAPEHATLPELVRGTEHEAAVLEFIERTKRKRMLNPHTVDKDVDGIFTGRYVENPFGTGDLPIWVASYAKADYGTGWVNCSAHDERDYKFAKKYGIPLKVAMLPSDPERAARVGNIEEHYLEDDGILTEPAEVRGLRWDQSRQAVMDHIKAKGYGRETTQYRLRDWGISRQRYWGAPIPIVYDPDGNPHPVPDEHLPWLLPTDVVNFQPKGTSPLGESKELVERTERIFGKGWRPELDTMDTFVCSSFYSFRYLAEGNSQVFVPKDIEAKWMPVRTYIGGAEHATKHLIYARFVSMVLADAGLVSTPEPYERMVHQGLVQGEKEFSLFKTADGKPVSAADVTQIREEARTVGEHEVKFLAATVKATKERVEGAKVDKADVHKTKGAFRLKADESIVVDGRSYKMSKSRGNAVSPDPVIDEYGCDVFRMFLMFLGPFGAASEWDPEQIEGPNRFLRRVFAYYQKPANISAATEPPEITRHLHRAIQSVDRQLADIEFNTAVSSLMSFWKALSDTPMTKDSAAKFVQLLAPIAPHIGEELWRVYLGNKESVFKSQWPQFDPAMVVEEAVEIGVQVNGKFRGRINVPREATQDAVQTAALALPDIARYLSASDVKKVVYVPGRLLNLIGAEKK